MIARHVDLGRIRIWLPTASQSKFGIFMDLATEFGLEFNRDAETKLREAWRASGARGRLDIDAESDRVSILAGRDSILEVATLIQHLTVPSRRTSLSRQDIEQVKRVIRVHKRPPRVSWKVGDAFSIRLRDGSNAFGQILWESAPASSQSLRAPICALFDYRAGQDLVQTASLLKTRIVTVLHILGQELDDGRWPIVGTGELAADPFSGPCGRPGEVGSRSWDGLEEIANAWFGLAPWNAYFKDDYLDGWLMPGVRRPACAKVLSISELKSLGISR